MTPFRRRAGLAVCASLVLTVMTGCTAPAPATPPPATTPSAARTTDAAPTPEGPLVVGAASEVATGLAVPWSVAFVSGSALVSERATGRILEIAPDGTVREAGVVEGVAPAGEGGLLGLAVSARDLYAYSTAADGNRIQRFPLTGSGGSLALGPAETLVSGLPAARNHNGGRIAFGPDGMLYVGVGDAGDPDAAQDPGSLAGKILRLTPDGDVPYDNPLPGSPVYSLGHRNVQGLAWASDGTMFASEFGQDTWDELNVIVPGGNYGWPVVEGAAGDDAYIDPVQQWTPDEASPSGIAIVGETLFLANLRGEVLRAVPAASPGERTDHLAGEYGRLRAVAAAPDGTLWVLTGNTDGRGAPREGDDRILRLPVSGA